ncbi:hypothetical protein LTR05_001383 [Lithohypha guttulata]|uniref:Uncharacterized protein n=1 Tax=Lithohypha guttulata TaxID=1690604 RepID=A0AAN7YK59_9EURO|nr:hypothetical protein LTR05_001383 [Lithohypha guttulata]
MSHSAEQDSRSRAASPRANQAVSDIQRKMSELEEAILQHPSLKSQYKVVRTYLVLDSWVLEPISFLRQDGLWAVDMAPMHDTSMKLPKPEQIDHLANLHASLFQSPPTDLFNMICKYRRYSDFKDTGIIQRLEELKQSWLPAKAVQAENSRTAPQGGTFEKQDTQ